jgi:hypothetical protein
MSQFELDERTRAVLDRVRHKRKCLWLYDMPEEVAASEAHMAVNRAVKASGIDHSTVE